MFEIPLSLYLHLWDPPGELANNQDKTSNSKEKGTTQRDKNVQLN